MAAVLCLAAAAYGAVVLAAALYPREREADIAVVLGNEVLADGAPSARLTARLQAALGAWRRGLVPLILVSGGTGASGFNEASVMRSWLEREGVPADAVIEDDEGADTMATAEHAAALMRARGLQRAMVATQWFHVPRCIVALSRYGIDDVAAVYPAFVEARDAYSFARELAAIPYYAFIRSAPPPSAPRG